jgi:hypothetical protein
MKTLLSICLFALFSTAVYVSMPVIDTLPEAGVSVVEFNASFNASNSVDWLEELSDCKGIRVDIAAEPSLQKEHKIVVVPTIIVFNDGEETERFQANIMMVMESTKEEVQDAIDEILMSDF